MRELIVSAEATCDLAAAELNAMGAAHIPMEFCVGNDRYYSDDGPTPNECFKRMRAGALTSTGLVNQTRAEEYLEGLVNSGKDVVHLGFSSTLSGTYVSFANAAEEVRKRHPEAKLAVLDTTCGSFGQAILLEETIRRVKEGATFEEAAFFAENYRLSVCHTFTPDDLSYLGRSGRISKIAASLGNAIRLKPIMCLANDGRFAVIRKVMNRRKSLTALAEEAEQRFNGKSDIVYVTHADSAEEAEFLAGRVKEATGVTPRIREFGMVIGSHCGPGTMGVFYVGNERGR